MSNTKTYKGRRLLNVDDCVRRLTKVGCKLFNNSGKLVIDIANGHLGNKTWGMIEFLERSPDVSIVGRIDYEKSCIKKFR